MKHCVSIALLADQIGDTAAARLRQRFGGAELHVPKRRAGRLYAEIIGAIGTECGHELIRIYAGESLYIAMNAQAEKDMHKQTIASLRAQGKTWREVAAAYSFTRRFSERWARHLGGEEKAAAQAQRTLFDLPAPHPLDALSRR